MPAVRVLLAPLLALALWVPIGLGPAGAETVSVTDPAGDVWVRTQTDGVQWRRVPRRAVDDVRSVRVDHRGRGLTLTTAVRALPSASGGPRVSGPVHTVRRTRGSNLRVFTYLGGGRPSQVLVFEAGALVCRAAAADVSVDRGAERVVVELSRRCVKKQAWVRVRTLSRTQSRPGDYRVHRDPVGERGHGFGAFGPRVGRG